MSLFIICGTNSVQNTNNYSGKDTPARVFSRQATSSAGPVFLCMKPAGKLALPPRSVESSQLAQVKNWAAQVCDVEKTFGK